MSVLRAVEVYPQVEVDRQGDRWWEIKLDSDRFEATFDGFDVSVDRLRLVTRDRPGPDLVAFLRELSNAEDMPMHHAADIDQFMVEVLGVTP